MLYKRCVIKVLDANQADRTNYK